MDEINDTGTIIYSLVSSFHLTILKFEFIINLAVNIYKFYIIHTIYDRSNIIYISQNKTNNFPCSFVSFFFFFFFASH